MKEDGREWFGSLVGLLDHRTPHCRAAGQSPWNTTVGLCLAIPALKFDGAELQ